MSESLFGTSKYAKKLPPGMPADRRERYEAAEAELSHRYVARNAADTDWIAQFAEWLAWPETPYLSPELRAQFEAEQARVSREVAQAKADLARAERAGFDTTGWPAPEEAGRA